MFVFLGMKCRLDGALDVLKQHGDVGLAAIVISLFKQR
jgi:hypothetical protein